MTALYRTTDNQKHIQLPYLVPLSCDLECHAGASDHQGKMGFLLTAVTVGGECGRENGRLSSPCKGSLRRPGIGQQDSHGRKVTTRLEAGTEYYRFGWRTPLRADSYLGASVCCITAVHPTGKVIMGPKGYMRHNL